MAEVSAHSFRMSGLYDTAQYVLKHGEIVSPRGQKTKEVRGFTLRIADPTDSLLTGAIRPQFSPAIAAAEAAQLIGGVSDPMLMGRIAPNFLNFMNGGSFLGAYGPRIRTQLPQLINVLKKDASSRQALLQIWRPQDDLWADGAKDIPCTTSMQFFIRNDKLNMHTYMRSNDVHWGLVYDIFQFSQMLCTVAHALNLDVGEYVHTAGSMHVYERDFEKVDGIAHPSSEHVKSRPEQYITGFGARRTSIESAMLEAQAVVLGDNTLVYNEPYVPSLAWYFDVLDAYRV